ncbi:MAG: fibronectin type III domain-containing protein, partial [Flavobacteriales bacterium]|nr:fibronectin type III domain-containing protein [Flavobacteriales bacterium]
MYDSQRDLVLIGFEDINREWGGCDNDFNDAIFYTTASPNTAIETENFQPTYNTSIACNSVPENLRASDVGLYKATLSWDDFNEADSFRVRFREWGTDDEWEYRNAGASTSITLGAVLYDHLQPGTWYEWQAATTCGEVQTNNSVKHVFQTLTPCEMPTGNAATNITDNSARVSWTTVLDAQSYTMRYRKLGDTDYEWRNAQSNTYYDITGLEANTTYEWGVSATCTDLYSCIAPYLSDYTFTTNEEGRALPDDQAAECLADVNDITMENALSISTGVGEAQMTPADLNGDGMSDFILHSKETTNTLEYSMQSKPVPIHITGTTSITFEHEFNQVSVGDLDLDGKDDLLLINQFDNMIHFYRNGSIGDQVTYDFLYSIPTDFMPSHAALVDLEGTEKPELVVSFNGTNQIKLYRQQLLSMNETRTPMNWENYKRFTAGEAPIGVKAADVDQDGNKDLMVLNDLSNHFTLVYNGNEADSTYYIRSIYETGGLTKDASFGDFNG